MILQIDSFSLKLFFFFLPLIFNTFNLFISKELTVKSRFCVHLQYHNLLFKIFCLFPHHFSFISQISILLLIFFNLLFIFPLFIFFLFIQYFIILYFFIFLFFYLLIHLFLYFYLHLFIFIIFLHLFNLLL